MTFELSLIVGGFLVFALPVARLTVYQRQYWRIEDVELFIRPLNLEDFERITDPAEEWSLRSSICAQEFKKLKRQKTRLCAEHLSRMAHNAEVIQGWSYAEYATLNSKPVSPGDERTHLMFQISEAATEIRIYALIAQIKVRRWLVLRADLLPLWLMPPLKDIRKSAGVDLLATYKELTELAKAGSRLYGSESSERICRLL